MHRTDQPTRKSRLYLVGLGPGPVELLTLRSWELLASGFPVMVVGGAHPAVDEMAARGLDFIRHADDPSSIIEWARTHETSVLAVPGSVNEWGAAPELHLAGASAGVAVETVPSLGSIDLLPLIDPHTETYSAAEAVRAGKAFARLVSVMARLRAPGGCPWDQEQTHESLAIHLLEEAYETLDAIDRSDVADLEEELGDLMLQIVFHAELAQERGDFSAGDVVEELIAKLVHRHPHVFGDAVVSGAGEVLANWEKLKGNKERKSLDEGIPKNLPALLYAHKVQRRIAGAGREHPPDEAAVSELASTPRIHDEAWFGELLYEIVAIAQRSGIDPEGALRRAADGHLYAPETTEHR